MSKTNIKNFPWLIPTYEQLIKLFETKKFVAPILLSGIAGIGKQILAEHLVAYMLCTSLNKKTSEKATDNSTENFTYHACNNCKSCKLLLADTHPDLFVTNSANNTTIGIDKIREIIEFSEQTTQLSETKFVLIDAANKFTQSAANALLKTLESSPGEQTKFILLADNLTDLLATIKSRTHIYKLKTPTKDTVFAWLQNYSEPNNTLQLSYFLASGAPLNALNFIRNQTELEVRKKYIQDLMAVVLKQTCPISLAQQKTIPLIEALYLSEKVLKTVFAALQDLDPALQQLFKPILGLQQKEKHKLLAIIADINELLLILKQNSSLNQQLAQERVFTQMNELVT